MNLHNLQPLKLLILKQIQIFFYYFFLGLFSIKRLVDILHLSLNTIEGTSNYRLLHDDTTFCHNFDIEKEPIDI